jgi:exonuclease III
MELGYAGAAVNNINFLDFDIKSLNCNSLNLCCSTENYDLKMDAICNLDADIIFLSDIRLGQMNNKSATHKINSSLLKSRLRNHQLFFNSSMNKRGVAILITKKIKTEIIEEFKDHNENILLIRVVLNGAEIVLGSIYRPNTTDREFYRNIDNFLNRNKRLSVVLGGDWNTTWDNSLAEANINVLGMARTPNMINGGLLRDLAERHGLTDPFRVLNPYKQSFSYKPFGNTRLNKSRLDFFVISSNLLGMVKECCVFPGLLSNQFDHKPVYLKFNKDRSKSTGGLKNWFLDDDLIRMSTEIAALQVYSNAIIRDENPQIFNALFESSNTLVANCTQCLQLKEKITTNIETELVFEQTLLAAKIGEHNATIDQLPNWETLSNCSKMVCDKEFFQALTDRISEQMSRVQCKLNKHKNQKKNMLIKEINLLEDSYLDNRDRIRNCEQELNKILDLEHRRLIQNKKIFENLTFEKPSRRFLDIAHNIGKGEKLANINNDNGIPFETSNDLNDYITNFYADLYIRDPGVEGTIEDFLGQEICNHPLVRNSKLSNDERYDLENDLTYEELLTALNESNLKSAPGIDGFSNLFIKKFFYILGRPLFKCCTSCLNDGTLIETFSLAQIKLIPKKGDTTKLKNWRPISLLSNFYKLLSRAINNRLKKVVNRVLSRAQKGFNKSRQIHEVIINLDETINYCKANSIKGAMICVDQAKAFDSVDHNYMEKCFKFSGFGERFISWLKTIGTGRKACVILENGEKSSIFDLMKGTARIQS